MPRRSLRPELNRIRAWVRQGRTDAWIAHQLEVTVQQIQAFKREHDLDEGSQPDGEGPALDFDDEIDLRAEDDALIAAELEAAEARREDEAAVAEAQAGSDSGSDSGAGSDEEEDEGEGEGDRPSRRRRGRRGGLEPLLDLLGRGATPQHHADDALAALAGAGLLGQHRCV